MKVLRSALALLATFALSLSFAVVAENLPETAYDESESVPYVATPPFSGDFVPGSAAALQVVPTVPDSLFPHAPKRFGWAWNRGLAAHPLLGSLIILDHSLRC